MNDAASESSLLNAKIQLTFNKDANQVLENITFTSKFLQLHSPFIIGRAPGCYLRIIDESNCVSGKHCQFHLQNDNIILTDLSTNGTSVNLDDFIGKGNSVTIKHGDVVHLVKYSAEKSKGISFSISIIKDETSAASEMPKRIANEISHSPNALTQLKATDGDVKSDVDSKVTNVGACASNENEANSDPMSDNLTCCICCEIIHSCISVQPCMHSFCGGCYSDWMHRSNKCPQCRADVDRISKNHMINNVIEAFLEQHPHKKRPAEEIAELEAKDKITDDMLYPPKKKIKLDEHNEIVSSDDESVTEEESDGEDDHSFDVGRLNVCFQCPSYSQNQAQEAALLRAPTFVCAENGDHILCHCCLQVFPDRGQCANIPPTQCTDCGRRSCNLYWGCMSPHCNLDGGCLFVYRDFKISEDQKRSKILAQNGNESRLLADYMAENNVSVDDLMQQSLVNPNAVLCNKCCLSKIQSAAYDYRKNTDISAPVRPDCHWGRNCRTQKHNDDHARRFNHICEQTKFA